MKKIILGILLIGSISFPLACGGNNNSPLAPPSSTPGPTSTPTLTFTVCANASGTPCTPTYTSTVTPTPTSTPTVTSTYTPLNTPTLVTTITLPSSTYPYELADTGSSSVTLFVPSYNYSIIERYTSTGTALSSWGGPGTGNLQFNSPLGVAADGNGNLFVADTFNNRIQKISSSGAWAWSVPSGSVSAGSALGQFLQPRALGLDAAGNLFVADSGNNRVVELNAGTGAPVTSWSGTFGGQTLSPFSLAVDPVNGWVYTAGAYYGFRFKTDGTFLNNFGGPGGGNGNFNAISALAVNPTGTRLYVCDENSHAVQILDPYGNYLGGFGNSTLLGSGTSPTGVAIDGSGIVYIASFTNNAIQVYGP